VIILLWPIPQRMEMRSNSFNNVEWREDYINFRFKIMELWASDLYTQCPDCWAKDVCNHKDKPCGFYEGREYNY